MNEIFITRLNVAYVPPEGMYERFVKMNSGDRAEVDETFYLLFTHVEDGDPVFAELYGTDDTPIGWFIFGKDDFIDCSFSFNPDVLENGTGIGDFEHVARELGLKYSHVDIMNVSMKADVDFVQDFLSYKRSKEWNLCVDFMLCGDERPYVEKMTVNGKETNIFMSNVPTSSCVYEIVFNTDDFHPSTVKELYDERWYDLRRITCSEPKAFMKLCNGYMEVCVNHAAFKDIVRDYRNLLSDKVVEGVLSAVYRQRGLIMCEASGRVCVFTSKANPFESVTPYEFAENNHDEESNKQTLPDEVAG